MAISGAALSFDLGEYESGGLNALLELLTLTCIVRVSD